jgi:hypothetical protein
MPDNQNYANTTGVSKHPLFHLKGVQHVERLDAFLVTADQMLLGGMSHTGAAEVLAQFSVISHYENGGEATEFWDKLYETARKLTARRQALGKTRTLWGTTPIVSLKYGVEADRRLGLDASSLVFNSYYITSDFDLNFRELDQFILNQHINLFYAFRRYVFAWALLNFDVFNFYNDCGILQPQGGYGSDHFGINLTEMQALRRAGKTLFTYAYGADHRMREKTLSLAPLNFCIECPEPGKFCLCDDVGGMKMLETIGGNATRMIGFGLSMDLLPSARFLNYLALDTQELQPRGTSTHVSAGAALRVGHFPNHGFFKGSQHLLDAVVELRAEGQAIELVKLSGISRTDVIAAMLGVDVVVDQLISGAFGLTGVEAMALGRPVIAHLRPGIQISARHECPVIEADPSTIKQVLADIVADRSKLNGLGKQGRRYVLRHHSIDALAVGLNDLYADHFPFAPLGTGKRTIRAFMARLRIWKSVMALDLLKSDSREPAR